MSSSVPVIKCPACGKPTPDKAIEGMVTFFFDKFYCAFCKFKGKLSWDRTQGTHPAAQKRGK